MLKQVATKCIFLGYPKLNNRTQHKISLFSFDSKKEKVKLFLGDIGLNV